MIIKKSAVNCSFLFLIYLVLYYIDDVIIILWYRFFSKKYFFSEKQRINLFILSFYFPKSQQYSENKRSDGE